MMEVGSEKGRVSWREEEMGIHLANETLLVLKQGVAESCIAGG